MDEAEIGEEFVQVAFEEACGEIDLDYEFDAARFFDFSRPESLFQQHIDQLWFDSAPSYPPSPFIVKLNWSTDIEGEDAASCGNSDGGERVDSVYNNPEIAFLRETDNGGVEYQTGVAPDMMKETTRSLAKSSKLKSSTLMKPTASHLSKQSKVQDVNSKQLCRSQRSPSKVSEMSLNTHPGFERQATKRQKLESGYLRKVAHLKHHTLLLHKIAKKVVPVDTTNPLNSRAKVTIPREPDLETAHRAEMRRSKNAFESDQQKYFKYPTFKARPLNRKILESPSLVPSRKSKPQLPVFQMFHLKTMERALQHSSASVSSAHDLTSVLPSEDTDFKGPKVEGVTKYNHETLDKLKARAFNKKLISSKGVPGATQNIQPKPTDPTELNMTTEKQLPENPPIDLFNKLSLGSEFENNTVPNLKLHPSMKGSKENAPGSFHLKRCVGRSSKCGSTRRTHELAHGPNMNRSLDIR